MSTRTIARALAANGARKNTKSWKKIDCFQLRLRLLFFYYEEVLPDKAIVEILQDEGFPELTEYAFVRIRRAMGIKRRLRVAEFEERFEEYKAIVQKEFDNRTIENYGRTLLYTHFRQRPSLQLNLGRYGTKLKRLFGFWSRK